MKKLLRCRVTIVLLLGWVVLSAAGFLGRDTIYKNYVQSIKTTPYFVLVFQGIHDGIYPWSHEPVDFWAWWDSHGSKDEPVMGDAEDGYDSEIIVAETETEEVQKEKEFIEVDKSYFDDAVFIGDSRTVGLHDYGGLKQATFYATVGLNIYDMWKEPFCEVDGEKVTLEEALSAREYKKIYFQIGINEMGRGTIDSFMEAYIQSIDKFKQLQPDAIIYVQGIMRVTKEKSDKDPIFNNPGILARNDRIAQLADNITVFYIDVNEAVCDNSGNLKPELTFDNLHLLGSKYSIWVDFLLTKGITTE